MPATDGLGLSLAGMPPVTMPQNLEGLARENGRSPAEIGKAFEAMFASLLIKQMRQSLEEDTLFANDSGDVRGGMFDQFMGEHIAGSGRLGIGDMVRQQLEQRSAPDMIAASDTAELAEMCAHHLRQEELLLEEILPMLREMQAGFGKPNAQRLADQKAEQVAQLIEMMTSKRERLRANLAAWLGIEPRHVTFSMAVAELPESNRASLEAATGRVKKMIEELVKLTYWVSLHLRIHLDAFHRLICDLTNTAAGSGRYGPRGQAEAPAYRPIFQVRG